VVRIAPSILSADFACLGDAISRVEPVADLLHVDVMDGHFVPNLTVGPPVVAAINRHTEMVLDCHLMMTNPGDYLSAFQRAGADWVSVHIEVDHTAELLEEMRGLGLRPGLAINPETPFEAIAPWLGDLHHVLVMTVHPGFGGQEFIAEVVPKLRAIAAHSDGVIVEVDGGIDARTVPIVAEAGARCFVAGHAVFDQPDPAAAVTALRGAAEAAIGGPR
jgi:ribulose-phosphate 3-epimerase